MSANHSALSGAVSISSTAITRDSAGSTASFDDMISLAAAVANVVNVRNMNTSFTGLNIAYIVIGVVGIVLNLLACVVMIGYGPLRKRLPNYFLIGQCALDLVIGTTEIIIPSLTLVNASGLSLYFWCYLIGSRVTFTAPLMASIWNLVAMAVERYMEIVHPVRHKTWLTKRRIFVTLLIIFFSAVALKCFVALPTLHIVRDVCTLGLYPNAAAKLLANVFNQCCPARRR